MKPEDFLSTLFTSPLMTAKKEKVNITRVVLFESVRMDGAGWFRVFGVGIKWKDLNKHRLLFSERNGYVKFLKIGKWQIKFLPYK